jgi:hypothetical protein
MPFSLKCAQEIACTNRSFTDDLFLRQLNNREINKLIEVRAYAAQSAKADLAPWKFNRRALGPNDVLVEIVTQEFVIQTFIKLEKNGAKQYFPWFQVMKLLELLKK